MSYIDRSVVEGEKLIAKANLTNFIYINELFYFIIIIFYHLFNIYVLDVPYIYSLKSLFLLFVLLILIFISEVLRDKSIELGVTDSRIIAKKGFINIVTLDTHLDNINNIKIKSTFLGRIIKYGTIIIELKDHTYSYDNISNPWKIKDLINEQIIILKRQKVDSNEWLYFRK